jgi:4'-phosphopantetheinyl transferase
MRYVIENVPEYWPHVNTVPPLRCNEIHVWRLHLDLDQSPLHALSSSLTPDELLRVSRFPVDRHRRQFICCRGFLCILLGAYLNIKPKALRFEYGAHGKPQLACNGTPAAIYFNLSHAEELAVIAITAGSPVGVDIEWMRDDLDYLSLLKNISYQRSVRSNCPAFWI